MKNWKLKREQGFTFMELMVTVAIIIALVAIGANVAFDLNVKYKQKNIDSYAEAIYMAAQNRLLELRANGLSCDFPDARPVESAPSDAKGDEGDGLYYIRQSSEQTILPAGSIESTLRDGDWVIEYNPKTAYVYAVFYTDEEADKSIYNYQLDYDRYQELRNREGDNGRWANDALVGYWGGSSGEISLDTWRNTPTVEVQGGDADSSATEGNACVLKLSCRGDKDDDPVFSVVLHGMSSGEDSKEIEVKATEYEGSTWYATLEIDSLEPGKSFEEKFDNLWAGENVQAEVSVKSDNEKYAYITSTSDEFNPLFGSGVRNEDDSRRMDSVTISCVRHLRNLSCVDENLYIATAVQKENLNLEDAGSTVVLPLSCKGRLGLYDGSGLTISNLKASLFAETDASVKSLQFNGVSISGSGNAGIIAEKVSGNNVTISNITVTDSKVRATDGNAGMLVGTFSGTGGAIKNCEVYLEHTEMAKENGNVIAQVNGQNVGGLVGQCTGNLEISRSFAAVVLGESGKAASVGGLVGSNTGSIQMTLCYADCYLYGVGTGGLVGISSGTVGLEDCYAAGYQTATEQSAGLVLGELSSAVNVYTISAMNQATPARYSTGTKKLSDGKIGIDYSKLCYRVSGSDTSKDVVGDKIKNSASFNKAFSGSGSAFSIPESNTSDTTTSDTTTSNVTTHPYNLDGNTRTDYPFPALDCFGTHYGDWDGTIDVQMKGGLYYFEKYGEDDFGVWSPGEGNDKLKNNPGLTVCNEGYAIKYEAGKTYKFTDINGNVWTLVLNDSNGRISQGKKVYSWWYKGSYEYLGPSNTSYWDIETITVGGDTYYSIPKDITNVGYQSIGSFYHEVKVNGDIFYYNPYFAETISDTKGTPTYVTIRSPRHLYALGQYYDEWLTKCGLEKAVYQQELDLNFDSYDIGQNDTWSPKRLSPIGANGANGFEGTYDGGGHQIVDAPMGSNTDYFVYGLFGYNYGTIKNVNLVGDGKTTTLGVSNTKDGCYCYAGAIAAVNKKTIENCTVSNFDVAGYIRGGGTLAVGGAVGMNDSTGEMENVVLTGSSDTTVKSEYASCDVVYAGLLAGGNQGKIDDCSVTGYSLTAVNSDSGDACLAGGGLVGWNGGSEAKISNTTASDSGTLTVKGGSSSVDVYSGGLVGLNEATLENCNVTDHTLSATGSGKNAYVGGIVGQNMGTIQSENTTTVTPTVTSQIKCTETCVVGGVAGENLNTIKRYGVSSYTVKSTANSMGDGTLYVGGLIGRYIKDTTFENPTKEITGATLEVTEKYKAAFVGGLFGYSEKDVNGYTLKNCSVTAQNIHTGAGAEEYVYVGGLIGQNAGAKVTNQTANECTLSLGSTSSNFAYSGSAVGENSGTISNFTNWDDWTITTVNKDSSDYFGGGFVGYNKGTIQNISMTGNGKTISISDGDGGCHDLCAGTFVGVNEKTISNCTVNDYQLTVKNTYQNAVNNDLAAGGLVGRNSGEVLNCVLQTSSSSSLNVTGEGSYNIFNDNDVDDRFGKCYIGGLVGHNQGTVSNDAVANYNVIALVKFVNEDVGAVGGVVGLNDNGATVSNSTAVIPSMSCNAYCTNSYTGGFVGDNRGKVSNAYALSSISCGNWSKYSLQGGIGSSYRSMQVAGFAGRNSNTIENCYTASVVATTGGERTSTDAFGFGNAVSNCYYLMEQTVYGTKWNGRYWDGLTAYWTRDNTRYPFSYNGVDIYYELKSNISGAKAQKYSELTALNLTGFGRATGYNFPAIVKDSANNYIHYGMSPVKKDAIQVPERREQYSKPS